MKKLATYEGIVENGNVTPPSDADIPDRTRAYILMPDADERSTPRIYSPRLVHREQAKDFKLEVIEGPNDAGT